MSDPKTIGEILTNYFLNSQEPFAMAFRNHFALSNQSTNSCTVCSASLTTPLTDRLEDWLDNQDVMHLLHISPRTLQTLRTNGTLPFSRIGNKLFYRSSDIQRLLADNYTMIKIRDYGKRK
jgi:hypothetical protein